MRTSVVGLRRPSSGSSSPSAKRAFEGLAKANATPQRLKASFFLSLSTFLSCAFVREERKKVEVLLALFARLNSNAQFNAFKSNIVFFSSNVTKRVHHIESQSAAFILMASSLPFTADTMGTKIRKQQES